MEIHHLFTHFPPKSWPCPIEHVACEASLDETSLVVQLEVLSLEEPEVNPVERPGNRGTDTGNWMEIRINMDQSHLFPGICELYKSSWICRRWFDVSSGWLGQHLSDWLGSGVHNNSCPAAVIWASCTVAAILLIFKYVQLQLNQEFSPKFVYILDQIRCGLNHFSNICWPQSATDAAGGHNQLHSQNFDLQQYHQHIAGSSPGL